MSFIVKAAGAGLFGGLGLLGKALFGGKKKPRAELRPEIRDPARDELAAGDELARRRGAAADMITGVRGAEAASGAGRLVRGS